MKAKDLAKILMGNPEFEVTFSFSDIVDNYPQIRKFDHLAVDDIGYSDKIIDLGGAEQ